MSYDQQHPNESALSATAVQLNHTAIYARDRHLSAEFIATILGLKVGAPFGPFLPVDLGNDVTLDYYEKRDEPIQSQHYAFLVPDAQFDAMIARLEAVGVTYYADPSHTEPGPDQPSFRRSRRVLRGPGRPQHGDHDPALHPPLADRLAAVRRALLAEWLSNSAVPGQRPGRRSEPLGEEELNA